MEKPPYFPFFVQDFSSDGIVEAMTTLEVGAYILLLCKAWHEDPPGSLPSDDRILARWTRLTSDEWTACKNGVLAAFKLGNDNRYHQKRLRKEFHNLMDLYKKRSEAAKAGADSRWKNAKRITNASQPQCDRNAILCQSESESESDIIKNTAVASATAINPKRRFTDLWMKNYKDFFGEGYSFNGAKDGQAVDKLLKAATPEELMEIAQKAWRNISLFNSKQAVSIAGFASRFNEIRSELGYLKPKDKPWSI